MDFKKIEQLDIEDIITAIDNKSKELNLKYNELVGGLDKDNFSPQELEMLGALNKIHNLVNSSVCGLLKIQNLKKENKYYQ